MDTNADKARSLKTQYAVTLTGKHSFHQDIIDEFGKDFAEQMNGVGLVDFDRAALRLPRDIADERAFRPRAGPGLVEAIFGVSIFVIGSFSTAFVKNFVDDVWKAIVQPRLAKTLAKKGRRAIQLPFRHSVQMWFDVERVMVSVIVLIERPEDLEIAEDLIPVAFDKAALWLEQHGRTHPYLTYRIEHGDVSRIPTLSEEEPKP